MKKLLLPALGFVAGAVAGVVMRWGHAVLLTRPDAPGGEILIPALVGLLLVFGFSAGRGSKALMDADWAWKDGYKHGLQQGRGWYGHSRNRRGGAQP